MLQGQYVECLLEWRVESSSEAVINMIINWVVLFWGFVENNGKIDYWRYSPTDYYNLAGI